MLKSSVQGNRASKVLVCGASGCGKTAILEQLIYGNHSPGQAFATVEDVFVAHIDNDRGFKERLVFYDTAGLNGPSTEVSRAQLPHADAFLLVYSVENPHSFQLLDAIKRDIDRHKEKKEVVFMVLGNKCDLPNRKVDFNTAHAWAQREKIKLFEVSAFDRKKLIEPFVYLSSKLNPPSTKSSFPPLRSKGISVNVHSHVLKSIQSMEAYSENKQTLNQLLFSSLTIFEDGPWGYSLLPRTPRFLHRSLTRWLLHYFSFKLNVLVVDVKVMVKESSRSILSPTFPVE